MDAKLFLSNSDSTPMYSQIMAQISAKIMAGDWSPGQALPSIRELAVASQVSVITVKRAYLELEHQGLIFTRHGVGSFVSENTELVKNLTREEFRHHLLQMLAAAEKLAMPANKVLAAVRAELDKPHSAERGKSTQEAKLFGATATLRDQL